MAILEKKFKAQFKELKWKYYRFYFFSEIISALKHIEISFNYNIPTARIRRISYDSIKIEISPLFYSTYIKTSQDLLFVISHETLHYILGHLSSEGEKLKKKYGKALANAAMDIVINQMIYKELKGEPLQISKFYTEEGCPISLFVPPFKMKPQHFKREECMKWYDVINDYYERMETLDIIHYLNDLAEHIKNFHSEEVRKYYEDIVESSEQTENGAGKKRKKDGKGHEPYPSSRTSKKEGKRRIPKEFLDKILQAIEGWGLGGEVNEYEIKKARIKLKTELLSATREMADDEEEGGVEEFSRGGGVLPFYGRKDFLFIPLEIPTLLYNANPVPEESKGIRVYVDVSGSVHEFLSHIFYALDAIKNWIIFPIYGFSTEVFPISRRDLLKGRYKTTRGTDFNCIAKHIMKTRFRRAIVITDGWGTMHRKYAQHLKTHFQILTILVHRGSEERVKRFSQRVIKFELKKEV